LFVGDTLDEKNVKKVRFENLMNPRIYRDSNVSEFKWKYFKEMGTRNGNYENFHGKYTFHTLNKHSLQLSLRLLPESITGINSTIQNIMK
jgi:hypothetical protein